MIYKHHQTFFVFSFAKRVFLRFVTPITTNENLFYFFFLNKLKKTKGRDDAHHDPRPCSCLLNDRGIEVEALECRHEQHDPIVHERTPEERTHVEEESLPGSGDRERVQVYLWSSDVEDVRKWNKNVHVGGGQNFFNIVFFFF